MLIGLQDCINPDFWGTNKWRQRGRPSLYTKGLKKNEVPKHEKSHMGERKREKIGRKKRKEKKSKVLLVHATNKNKGRRVPKNGHHQKTCLKRRAEEKKQKDCSMIQISSNYLDSEIVIVMYYLDSLCCIGFSRESASSTSTFL